ncbi:hypothetical protein CSA80_04505 [Candidatus Saccharibacteria bacterium]|nr:MAG: hypothetical protein CR973_01420 [Candidatus Saccharibacteria bacterium]PID98929.1 MAG: hypothetical protein CSA80_04505 [Candidatus Saccharibacteria bacterium]
MIKAVIFDCFGVVITDALQEIRAKLARSDAAAAQEVRDILAANNRGLIDPQESNAKIAAILGVEAETLRAYIQAGEVRNVRLLQYIRDVKQHYKTAMLSNVARSSLERRFPDDELRVYFDEVVASAEIGYAKPDPEAYRITAERLGVAPEACVFTDDKLVFCEAAESVGMQAVLYTDFMQFRAELEQMLLYTEN